MVLAAALDCQQRTPDRRKAGRGWRQSNTGRLDWPAFGPSPTPPLCVRSGPIWKASWRATGSFHFPIIMHDWGWQWQAGNERADVRQLLFILLSSEFDFFRRRRQEHGQGQDRPTDIGESANDKAALTVRPRRVSQATTQQTQQLDQRLTRLEPDEPQCPAAVGAVLRGVIQPRRGKAKGVGLDLVDVHRYLIAC
jgi:hypothetical protein